MADFPPGRLLMAIPSINGGPLLAHMLPTLRVPGDCVIVLDQGSSDDTASICAKNGVELVQLGRPHTYTEASNIGARIARERGVDYVCISNNDIAFKTDVLRQMLVEMDEDPRLGIVAPSQIIVDKTLDAQALSYRVCWNLEAVEFFHDTIGSVDPVQRLEADFCELTCALVRLSAIDEIGFLDDEYGFYHEDADFGFRLQAAGYSCAYLPTAQIEHFSSSTFNREPNQRKAEYIAKNRLYFACKHLGLRINYDRSSPLDSTDDQLAATLGAYIESYGLLDPSAPELVMGNPGPHRSDYLLTTFSGASLPGHWVKYIDQYTAIMASSRWTQALMEKAGFDRVFHLPVGVETDIFHPWGQVRPRGQGRLYLMVVDGGQVTGIAAALTAWRRFRANGRDAKLIMLGPRLHDCIGGVPNSSYRDGKFDISYFKDDNIEIYETLNMIDSQVLATFYRTADYSLFVTSDPVSTIPILESLACGTPCLFGAYGAAAELAHEHALTFADAGPGSVSASVFSPGLDDLLRCLDKSFMLDAGSYQQLRRSGLSFVCSTYTMRHTVMALYNALSTLQTRDPREKLDILRRRQRTSVQAIGWQRDVAAASPGVTQKVGAVLARRTITLGRLIQQFGRTWQDSGLRVATRTITAELQLFTKHRSRLLVRSASKIIRSARFAIRGKLGASRAKRRRIENAALLVGYIDADLGLGQSLRGLALALSGTDVRFGIYPFTAGVEGRRSKPYMRERYDREHVYAVNVIEVATNELRTVFENVTNAHYANSYNILRTYWELSRAPDEWRGLLGRVDEIWAPNSFVADSFRHIFEGPITIVPPCVKVPEVAIDGRMHFKLDNGRYYFVFSFDYFSFPQRKNPLAVVRAFRQAFPDLATPVGLIVKSTGAVGHFPKVKQELQDATRQDGRIEIMDTTLDRTEMLALLKAADCYVSLHRAEGFGLGMAEAMAFGKPVIATGYSGNAEFVTPETAYPIPYKLRTVPPDGYVYPKGQVWAEPDEFACAAAMLRAFGDRAEAAERARAGQDFIERRFGPENVGRIAADRLNAIFAQLAVRPTP
ncbi:glycosyltransferase [Methylobacterium sp. 88A]|uniref:glycosyltransferase n=1 Tax=Methylobacterium sp. 88A TaxID=1131813 RepID=UPI0003812002|nr:glycosyltransferase [Methylobacterium sp. 88A]